MAKSCLLVDDDRVCLQVFSEYLQNLGLEVEPTLNAKEGIEYCKKQMPDIIVLDLQMPQKHGGEFLKELHAFKAHKKPYIVICSGASFADEMFESEESKKALQSVGANAFLVKPCRVDDFKEALKNHLY